MFGCNPAASIVHKIIPSGKFETERSFFRNSLVSLRLVSLVYLRFLPPELVVVNDGPEMRKYFQYNNHY